MQKCNFAIMAKVLLINGSPHQHGNTSIALDEISRTLSECGIESEILWIGNQPVRGCVACGMCKEAGHCVFTDEIYSKAVAAAEDCDGIVIASPVYYGGPNGSLCALLDRFFYSAGKFLAYKPAASVAICRRGGASAAFDRLNKYFTINCMPLVSSQYWNSVHGKIAGDAKEDLEGLQTMRTLARNMAWMIGSLNRDKHPEREKPIQTSFIR